MPTCAFPGHSFDEKLFQFVSTYRRRLRCRPQARGNRVFVDFEGVMTAATVWLNGRKLGEYKGGYTPFSFELTSHANFDGENVLTVYVDSTERADIPPFGYEIDYLTFGGIYREVAFAHCAANINRKHLCQAARSSQRQSIHRCGLLSGAWKLRIVSVELAGFA